MDTERRICRTVLLGAALGDAMGLSTEFMPRTQAQAAVRKWDLRANALRGWERDQHRRGWTEGDWTDDTDQTMLLLRAYVAASAAATSAAASAEARRSVLVSTFASQLVRWERAGFPELGDTAACGIGSTVGMVVCSPLIATAPHLAGLAAYITMKQMGMGTQANGALMRTVPCALAHVLRAAAARAGAGSGGPMDAPATTVVAVEAVEADAAAIARVTHPDPACVATTVATCVTLAHLLTARGGSTAPLGGAAIRAAVAAGQAAGAAEVRRSSEWIRDHIATAADQLEAASRNPALSREHQSQAAYQCAALRDGAQMGPLLHDALSPDALDECGSQLTQRTALAAAAAAASGDAASVGGAGATAAATAATATASGSIPASEIALLSAFGPLEERMGWTMHCLHAAFWALRQAARAADAGAFSASAHGEGEGGVEEAVQGLYADVLLALCAEGGDADTNGVVAGALLTAALGPRCLPPHWLSQLGLPAAAATAAATATAAAGPSSAANGRAWLDREVDAFLDAVCR